MHVDEEYVTYYEPPSARRNLNSTTNSDGSTTTSDTVKSKTEAKEMAMYYKFFYMISNMGGLYAGIMVILGIFMRPIVNAYFNTDMVNDAHQANQKGLAYIKLLEERNSQMIDTLKKNLEAQNNQPK